MKLDDNVIFYRKKKKSPIFLNCLQCLLHYVFNVLNSETGLPQLSAMNTEK